MELASELIADAKHFHKTKDGIVGAALRSWFNLSRPHRAGIYKYLPKKTLGRPIL
jgi:hypothetical protein